MTDLDGALRRDGDRLAVRFQRRYDADPAEVWSALVEPDRLRRWLGVQVLGGAVEPGGGFTFRWSEEESQQAHCRVLTFDPPTALELTWSFTGEPDSVLRYDLVPDGTGTLLTLDHRLLPPDQAAGYSAGWHAYLDGLTGLLGGTELEPWGDRFMAIWPGYQELLADLPGR